MKTFFTATLVIIVFSSLNAQWYMAVEDGMSIRKIKLKEQTVNNSGGLNTVNAMPAKPEAFHVETFFIGAKFGYEFNPFLIELDGNLGLNMSGIVGMYSGIIFALDNKKNLKFTPLLGVSLNHLDFSAAGRLQYKHFFLEANKTGNTAFYSLGIKCY